MTAHTLPAQAGTVAPDWHRSGQAKAILNRCQVGEFVVIDVPCAAWDERQFRGLTMKACAKIERLETLRRDAIATALGYSFKDVNRAGHFDEVLSLAYLQADGATPGVHVVLRDTFADRALRFTPVRGEAA